MAIKTALTKCVIYGRVSTFGQDYGRQIDDLDEWAKKNGYQVVERFAEKITGASKAYERKEFSKLKDYIEEHNIKMILVSELSRVGRMGVRTRLEIEELAERGVNMFFYASNQYTLKDGKVDNVTMMQIGLILDVAKMELERLKYNIKSGLKNSARKGKIHSSKFKAYGFTSDENKNIVVNKDELKIIEKIFNFFDSGMTTHNITAYLNENKIPTRYNDFKGTLIRGKKAESYSWNTRTVYRILTNRLLIGERHHKNELVFQFKPVIDVDLFNRVQQKLTDRSNTSIRVINNNNYLKGIIFCECGCGMFMNINEAKRVNSYICLSKIYAKLKKQKACEHPSINITKLLTTSYLILIGHYISLMQSKSKINFDDKIPIKNIEISNSDSTIKKLKKYLDNLYDDYNKRLIDLSLYKKKKKSLEEQIENETESNKHLKTELKELQQLKSKPVKDSYTYEQYLLDIKNIVKKIVIGSGSKSIEKTIKKTKTDVAIKVTITTVFNDVISYHVTKFSDLSILFESPNVPESNNIPQT